MGRGSQTCRLTGTGRCADVERRLDFPEDFILQGMDAGGLSIRAPDGAARGRNPIKQLLWEGLAHFLREWLHSAQLEAGWERSLGPCAGQAPG